MSDTRSHLADFRGALARTPAITAGEKDLDKLHQGQQ